MVPFPPQEVIMTLGSVLGSIMGNIFGIDPNRMPGAQAHPAPKPTTATSATPTSASPAPQRPAEPASFQPVDVEKLLDEKAAHAGQKLNWKTSIVDLMKLLGIDSSLENRKALADELGYTGDTSDSAAMNIWLHKQVMQRVAANGGKAPVNLTD
jgi:hypothetical protein